MAYQRASLEDSVVKNLLAGAGDASDTGSLPAGEDPGRGQWQPHPVFLLGKLTEREA